MSMVRTVIHVLIHTLRRQQSNGSSSLKCQMEANFQEMQNEQTTYILHA